MYAFYRRTKESDKSEFNVIWDIWDIWFPLDEIFIGCREENTIQNRKRLTIVIDRLEQLTPEYETKEQLIKNHPEFML